MSDNRVSITIESRNRCSSKLHKLLKKKLLPPIWTYTDSLNLYPGIFIPGLKPDL